MEIRTIANGHILTVEGIEYFIPGPLMAPAAPRYTPTPAPEQPEAKKRGRPAKSTKPVDELDAPAETAEAPQTEGTTESVSDTVDVDVLKKLMAELYNTKGLNTCRAILERVGAKNLTSVSEDKYAELAALIKDSLSGAEAGSD